MCYYYHLFGIIYYVRIMCYFLMIWNGVIRNMFATANKHVLYIYRPPHKVIPPTLCPKGAGLL